MDRKTLASIGAVGLVALAATSALAQDGDAPATEAATPDESKAERHEQAQARFAEALAAELGLPTDEVAAAIDTVQEQLRAEHDAARAAALRERLDAAVADGRLTQEQADAIAEAAEEGVLGGFAGRRGHRGAHAGFGARWGGAGAEG
jgi:protein-disulfide isomerase-like protein with CxxC motif